MEFNQILVNIIGLGTIGLIYLFFFGKKEEIRSLASEEVLIKVAGGYKPSVIKARREKPITLTFVRTEDNSCLEEVVIPDHKIKAYLPLNREVSITITPKKNEQFYCGMNMYKGKIMVN